MSNAKLKVDDHGRIHLDRPELTDVCDAITDVRSELREVSEAIRTVADAFDKVTARMDKQNEALQAIAAAVMIQEPSHLMDAHIDKAIRKIEHHFAV